MLRVQFVFVGEGSSDAALVPHLEQLCVEAGAEEARGEALDLRCWPRRTGSRVVDKVIAALELHPTADLLFVHRDADDADPEPRHREIAAAVEEAREKVRGVAVVPVQELEAWLLFDEAAIRRVAENPGGRMPLQLPAPERVEYLGQPKERLMHLLAVASELSSRRLERFKKSFPRRRYLLLELLDTDGPLRRVPAWQRLCADLERALALLLSPRETP